MAIAPGTANKLLAKTRTLFGDEDRWIQGAYEGEKDDTSAFCMLGGLRANAKFGPDEPNDEILRSEDADDLRLGMYLVIEKIAESGMEPFASNAKVFLGEDGYGEDLLLSLEKDEDGADYYYSQFSELRQRVCNAMDNAEPIITSWNDSQSTRKRDILFALDRALEAQQS